MNLARYVGVAGSVLAVAVLSGCTASGFDGAAELTQTEDAGLADRQDAVELAQATDVHPETGGTLLEGPTFGDDNLLYFVDVMAPPGAPKVLRMDVNDPRTPPETVYTDADASALTSAQFSPADGRLYVTDFLSGSVVSMSAEGTDARVVFEGEVDGSLMQADDIAFDPDGNMFITDTRGTDGPGWITPGRVIRVGVDGSATVLARDLPSPNGISFDEDFGGLWVAQYNANRIDYYQLDETREEIVAAHPGMYVEGGQGRIDSTAVDAEGNVYQAFHGKPEIRVYSKDGDLLQTIVAPGEGLESATNIAIIPGSTRGYMTVSGSAGGFIYTFDALGEGIRQSNGG